MLRLARSLAGLLAWQGVLGYWRVRLAVQTVRQEAAMGSRSVHETRSALMGVGQAESGTGTKLEGK